jgi:hypothetical protein
VHVPRDAFFLLQIVRNAPGDLPNFLFYGYRGTIPGSKAAGSIMWPLTAIYSRGYECTVLYLHSPTWIKAWTATTSFLLQWKQCCVQWTHTVHLMFESQTIPRSSFPVSSSISLYFVTYFASEAARGGAVGWDSALQAGSIPDGVTRIFHWHPSGRTMALGV